MHSTWKGGQPKDFIEIVRRTEFESEITFQMTSYGHAFSMEDKSWLWKFHNKEEKFLMARVSLCTMSHKNCSHLHSFCMGYNVGIIP